MARPRKTPAYPNVWHNDLISGVSIVAEPIISGASTVAIPVISGPVSVVATTRS
jgi:hypothetical protein